MASTEMFRVLKYIILCKQNFDYIQDTRVIYSTSLLQHCHTLRHMMLSKVNVAYLSEVTSCLLPSSQLPYNYMISFNLYHYSKPYSNLIRLTTEYSFVLNSYVPKISVSATLSCSP